MIKYIAFLRAINVGGHNKIKMEDLRKIFESMGFKNVETFIASGNVIFDSGDKDKRALEKRIEKVLFDELGYEVTIFVRSSAELAEIAQYNPFKDTWNGNNDGTLMIGFLAEQPGADAEKKLQSFRTETDEFHINATEVYWLCLTRISDSKFSGTKLEKALGMQTTMRNSTTIQKLAEKYKG